MLKKFAVALVAASLIAGPALAQGNNTAGTAPMTAGQPAKAEAKTTVKKHVVHKRVAHRHLAKKHVAKQHVVKQHAKKMQVSKAKHVHHGKTVKRVKHPAKNTAG